MNHHYALSLPLLLQGPGLHPREAEVVEHVVTCQHRVTAISQDTLASATFPQRVPKVPAQQLLQDILGDDSLLLGLEHNLLLLLPLVPENDFYK